MSVLHSANSETTECVGDRSGCGPRSLDRPGTSPETRSSQFSDPNREPPTMSQTVSDFIVRRLHQWDVRHIFGYPGDGINGVFGALNRAGNIEFVKVRLVV